MTLLIGWSIALTVQAGVAPEVEPPSTAEIQRPKSSQPQPPVEAEPAPVEAPPPSENVPVVVPPSPAEPSAAAVPQPVEQAAPAPAPVAAFEATSTLPPLGGVEEPAPVVGPTVELPRRRGRGLLIGSAVLAGGGWAASLGALGIVAGCDEGIGCIDAAYTGAQLLLAGWTLGHASVAMSVPAGILKGRYDATAHYLDGRSPREPAKFIQWGGAAIGVGAAVGLVSVVAVTLDSCQGNGCLAAFTVGTQMGWTLASVGAGLLSYGLAYRKRRADLPRPVSLRILPNVARGYGGLSLAGRF